MDSFLRDSESDWQKWYERHCPYRFDEIALDWHAVREVIQRRHVIVHSDGRVSVQYRAALGITADEPAVGTPLVTDETYMRNAIDGVLVFGTLLNVLTWAHSVPDGGQRAMRVLERIVLRLMKDGRWQAVEHLTRVSRSRLELREFSAYVLRFNNLLARKHLDGPDSIRDDLKRADPSAMAPVLRLVHFALLDDLEGAMSVLPLAADIDGLSAAELEDWPVFAGFREERRFLTAIKKQKAREARRRRIADATDSDDAEGGERAALGADGDDEASAATMDQLAGA